MAKDKNNKKQDSENVDSGAGEKKIRPEDIKRSLDRLQGEVDEGVEAAMPLALVAGVGLAVLVVAGVFLLGLRKGKRQTTLIEVRRF